jgi:predicted ATPase
MKITIENMGPVEYFELDLDKPLTVIYGGNNIGKSYAMQVCYLLMKYFYGVGLRRPLIRSHYFAFSDVNIAQAAEDIIEDFYSAKHKKNYEVDITNSIQPQIVNTVFLRSAEQFFESCHATFKAINNQNNDPFVRVQLDEFSVNMNIKEKTIASDYPIKTVLLQQREDADSHARHDTKKKFKIFIRGKKEKEIKLIRDRIQEEIQVLMLQFFENRKVSFYLPASRSGIYAGLSSVGAAVAQMTKNRTFITQGLMFPSMSEPVADYYLTLMNYNGISHKRLEAFTDEIEKSVLQGEVTFDEKNKAYQYKMSDNNYDLTQTSSMVAEISIIVAYLKYIIPDDNNVVLFIEEPEAHLHPENQVYLAETLAAIAKNIKLVISSHSNYIFNKLNNMALDGKIDGTIYNPIIMDPIGTRGRGRSLEVTSVGVKDENFTDITDKLWEEREEIIERRNSEGAEDD